MESHDPPLSRDPDIHEGLKLKEAVELLGAQNVISPKTSAEVVGFDSLAEFLNTDGTRREIPQIPFTRQFIEGLKNKFPGMEFQLRLVIDKVKANEVGANGEIKKQIHPATINTINRTGFGLTSPLEAIRAVYSDETNAVPARFAWVLESRDPLPGSHGMNLFQHTAQVADLLFKLSKENLIPNKLKPEYDAALAEAQAAWPQILELNNKGLVSEAEDKILSLRLTKHIHVTFTEFLQGAMTNAKGPERTSRPFMNVPAGKRIAEPVRILTSFETGQTISAMATERTADLGLTYGNPRAGWILTFL